MTMHPFIKILCLLAIIVLLVSGNPLRIVITTLILLIVLLLSGKEYYLAVLNMCKRMKWFWLSLLILYGWFISGTPVLQSDSIPEMYIPSIEGLSAGGLRGLALLSIVSAVVLMMKSTLREELIVSIMWLTYPLRLLNIKTAQFAARLVLTLDMVTNTDSDIRKILREQQGNIVQRGVDTLSTLLVDIEQQASKSPDTVIVLPKLDAPALHQWLIPIVLIIGLQSL